MHEVTRTIDLRSDTVTLPTLEMRQAMVEAELGDDVYGEDPTVNRLESVAADMVGKDKALFVPSGTMANLVSLLSHCERGDEAIMGDLSHTFLFEAGGSAVVGGIHPRTVRNQPNGTLAVTDIRAAVRSPGNPHYPSSRLVCLENTHNRCSGAVLTPGYMAEVRTLADEHGLAVHLDGARVFNAAVALGVPAADLCTAADSVSFCLSKGLCAPVGSLLCGSTQFIGRARRQRKMLGGGMRQAGVLAAAGTVALKTMVARLAEDHANARRLAVELSRIPGVVLDPEHAPTNIVIFDLAADAMPAARLAEGLASKSVLMGVVAERRLRAVTHHGVDGVDVDLAVAVVAEMLTAG